MNFIIKKFLILLIFNLVVFCSYKKINNIHGIVNLDNKAKYLEEGTSNKNDVIKNLGAPLLKEINNLDIWLYFEVRDTKNIYGSKKITVNNTLILEFDEKGLLSKKIFLNKDQMKRIEFSSDSTVHKGMENTLLKNILSSSRKRIDNLSKKFK